MRLGAPVHRPWNSPDDWVAAHRELGYGAAFSPVNDPNDAAGLKAYREAAERHGLVIAEVGAWSSPISADDDTRKAAVALCQERLAAAEAIGARCCVNISGSRGEQWDGPHPDNLTEGTFDLIVETVRAITDAVKPTRTYYSLETMPWMYPDSTESYLRLIQAIDRDRFAVHFDPVNLVCSPQRYFGNGALIREFVDKLGPWIKSCHAKDIALSGKLTTHLDEVLPGTGGLDYGVYLTELNKLGSSTPLMIEHLATPDEYSRAAAHLREVAREQGVAIA